MALSVVMMSSGLAGFFFDRLDDADKLLYFSYCDLEELGVREPGGRHGMVAWVIMDTAINPNIHYRPEMLESRGGRILGSQVCFSTSVSSGCIDISLHPSLSFYGDFDGLDEM
jgi:hypothetical protein